MNAADALMRISTQPTLVRWVSRFARDGALSQGPGKRREVALTFDDGPHAKFTPAVLDALDEAGARATFFVVGSCVAEHPELVREARRRGHEVGSHLFSHARETVFDAQSFDAELTRCRRQHEDILGEPLVWLRFPYGERGRQRCREVEARHGLRIAHWTYSSHDSRAASAEAVRARVAAGLRPGAIVLLHDALADADRVQPPYVADRSATILALPRIGADLRAKQLSAVTLSDLVR
ncbi:MAG: polysaccharide deacetylase family protein [Myxococcota bacterium]